MADPSSPYRSGMLGTAWWAGGDAYWNGFSEAVNPYLDQEKIRVSPQMTRLLKNQWSRGWNDAKKVEENSD